MIVLAMTLNGRGRLKFFQTACFSLGINQDTGIGMKRYRCFYLRRPFESEYLTTSNYMSGLAYNCL